MRRQCVAEQVAVGKNSVPCTSDHTRLCHRPHLSLSFLLSWKLVTLYHFHHLRNRGKEGEESLMREIRGLLSPAA